MNTHDYPACHTILRRLLLAKHAEKAAPRLSTHSWARNCTMLERSSDAAGMRQKKENVHPTENNRTRKSTIRKKNTAQYP
jgi:hypothetical protein